MVSAENPTGSFETWRNTGLVFVLKFSSRDCSFFFFFFFSSAPQSPPTRRDGGKGMGKKRKNDQPLWFSLLLCATVGSKPVGTPPKYNGCWLTCARKWKYYAPCYSPTENFCARAIAGFSIFSGNVYISTRSVRRIRHAKNEVSSLAYTFGVGQCIFPRISLVFSSFFLFSLCFFFSFFPLVFSFFFFLQIRIRSRITKNHRTLASFYRNRCLNVPFICLSAWTTLNITPRHGGALFARRSCGKSCNYFFCFFLFRLFSLSLSLSLSLPFRSILWLRGWNASFYRWCLVSWIVIFVGHWEATHATYIPASPPCYLSSYESSKTSFYPYTSNWKIAILRKPGIITRPASHAPSCNYQLTFISPIIILWLLLKYYLLQYFYYLYIV